MAQQEKPIALFLCTANACRSQMAEALARARWGEHLDCYSAGVKPGARVDPNALVVLKELGIDHTNSSNKSIKQAEELFGHRRVALVITVCSNAADECPTYRNSDLLKHVPFRDPPVLAREAGAEGEAALPYYREVRDEIRTFIDTLPSLIPALAAAVSSASGPAPAVVVQPAAAAGPAVGVPSPVLLDGVCDKIVTALELSGHTSAGQAATAADGGAVDKSAPHPEAISFFEKWLTLFVLACMIVGGLIGFYQPWIAHDLEKASFAGINAVVAVLLWVMIMPMLVQIDFAALGGAIALTSVLNYAVKPFTMAGLAHLFLRVFYVNVIPDKDLRDNYIAGLILLAGAPCTAMVFVWSLLMGGDGAYTLVQVAFNDLLMLVLFVPICALLIGVSDIPLPWLTIIYSVLLFIVAPVVLSAAIRSYVIRTRGEQFLLDKIVKPFKPVTILALLATLVLIFIFQGETIGQRPLHIVLLAVPIIVQCVALWAVCYAIGWSTCIPHERIAPASLIATSNFFELAVAVAISVYGLNSGAALATVVGVLVEVPVMLLLVQACNYLKPFLAKRCEDCPTICPGPAKMGEQVSKAMCCAGGGCGPKTKRGGTLASSSAAPSPVAV